MKDGALDLIREIAAEHGVALDRSDPVLILQTATRKILQDALAESQKAASDAMAQHRSELELAASKWQSDAKRVATQIVAEAQAAATASAAAEIERALRVGAIQLKSALDAHEKALAHTNLICALAVGVVVIGSAITVLAQFIP